jgi:hypothetical protein
VLYDRSDARSAADRENAGRGTVGSLREPFIG